MSRPEPIEGERPEFRLGSEAGVRNYYSTCWLPRMGNGHNTSSHAIHYGFHEQGVEDPEQGKLRLNEVVAESLELRKDSRATLVDAGCGVGGTAIHLATTHPLLRICAVNLGANQLELARRFASEADVTSRLEFVLGSYLELPHDAGTVDGIYAIESLCHSRAKDRFLTEALRVLRPGGRLVVVDFFRTEHPIVGDQQDAYGQVCAGFCLPDYYENDLVAQALSAGFARASTRNTTTNALPGILRSAAKAAAELDSGDRLPVDVRRHLEACRSIAPLVLGGELIHGIFTAVKGPA